MPGDEDVAPRRDIDIVKRQAGNCPDAAGAVLGAIINIDKDGVGAAMAAAAGNPDAGKTDIFISAAPDHERGYAIARFVDDNVREQTVAHGAGRTRAQFDGTIIRADDAIVDQQALDRLCLCLGRDAVVAHGNQAVGYPHIA